MGLVFQDLEDCRIMISLCSHLPHPAEDVDQWYSFIEKDQQRWSHVTSMLRYSSSTLMAEPMIRLKNLKRTSV